MRELGLHAASVVGLTGVYLLDFFCPVFRYMYCFVLIPVFSSFYILIYTRRGFMDTLGIFHANQTSKCPDPDQN